MNDDRRRQRPHAGPARGGGMSRMFFFPCRLCLRETIQLVCTCVCVRVAAANMTQVFCFTSSSSKKTNKIFFSLPCQPVGYTSRLPISYFLIPLLCLQLSSSQLLRLRIRRLDNLVLKQIAPAFGLNAASVSLPLAQAVRWSSNVWLASRQKHMS